MDPLVPPLIVVEPVELPPVVDPELLLVVVVVVVELVPVLCEDPVLTDVPDDVPELAVEVDPVEALCTAGTQL